MRKVFAGVLAAMVLLSSGATVAFAAGCGGGRYFVDADGNGICDNAGSMCIYTDGICDHYAFCQGQGGGHGRGFRGACGR